MPEYELEFYLNGVEGPPFYVTHWSCIPRIGERVEAPDGVYDVVLVGYVDTTKDAFHIHVIVEKAWDG